MSETVLVIGAGHAAGQLVSTLRHKGYDGRIVLAGEEPWVPYQRPPLSKKYLSGELQQSRLYFKPPGFYEDAEVDLRLSNRVTVLDTAARRAELESGGSIDWDHCVIATGSRVLRLQAPGADLPGIHYLRTIDDVDAIRAHFAPGARLVVVGAGYIGLEVAAVAAVAGLDVTVLELAGRVMSRVVSPPVSDFYEAEHRRHGVRLRLGEGVSGFEGDGRVEAVVTAAGERVAADFVVVGIGIEPVTELAANAGLACDDGILVDEHCRTRADGVYAVGDCTRHPNGVYGRQLRLESVHNALEQAKTAAAGICGERAPYNQVPWFWSDQYDLKLQIAGLSEGCDQTVIRGDPGDPGARSFACFYLAEGRLLAVDAVNSPREFMLSKPLIAARATPPVEALADPGISLKDLHTVDGGDHQ
ncbi:NAD(P)/FAD-dependent oxidoreductase [Lentisalinibacter sediminis]|uniref:NAD(P)/FAD-dependent oxidoreductase n=1 Tax=Lentisalinibacter sediminis TaxID=2992237 RepID=UPI00386C86F4